MLDEVLQAAGPGTSAQAQDEAIRSAAEEPTLDVVSDLLGGVPMMLRCPPRPGPSPSSSRTVRCWLCRRYSRVALSNPTEPKIGSLAGQDLHREWLVQVERRSLDAGPLGEAAQLFGGVGGAICLLGAAAAAQWQRWTQSPGVRRVGPRWSRGPVHSVRPRP